MKSGVVSLQCDMKGKWRRSGKLWRAGWGEEIESTVS